MRKEDCKKGMLVYFGDTIDVSDRFGGKMSRGVVIKVNPKRARVRSIDPAGKYPAGVVWTCHYSRISPVVGGEEVASEMAMRSFANPGEEAIRVWSEAQKSQGEMQEFLHEDIHIVRAIHEIYTKLDSLEGRGRIPMCEKINILFRALGREVSKEEAVEWVSK